tara:strand:+ start:71 stop:1804 length:1734 start_codon:yes stop_codon:yes gene_type:complete
MCGIAGIFSKTINKNMEEKCLKMFDLLSHRGPDGEGFFKNPNNIMYHKRLSIIDIKGGKQPIENQRYVLIANGEIYNDLEIRNQNKNYKFISHSDCESILCVYENFGINGFKKLRGMFAFAIYDKITNELILGRDVFGIKPLFFCYQDQTFIYSSEIQSILKSNTFKAKLNKNKIKELLQLQFTTGRNTIFDGILRLRPGEILTLKDYRIKNSKILDKQISKKNLNIQKSLEELESSVLMHQRSDVPYGLFFSGGIDSTLILYLMSLVNSNPINCYSIVFEPVDRNIIKNICSQFNVNLKFVNFEKNDFWNLLPIVANALDDPIIDYATVPTYKLAQVAKNDVKVVLSGEGGDEIFGGYGRYRASMRTFFKKEIFTNGAFKKFKYFNNKLSGWDFEIKQCKIRNMNQKITKLQKTQLIDFENWLPNDLLTKLDRCLMANGLEGRTPLVDKDIFQKFFLMKDNLKIKNGLGKHFLREFLNKRLKFYNAFEKKKGFTVPIRDWIPEKSKILEKILPRVSCLNSLFSKKEIAGLCKTLKYDAKASIPVWHLIFFALWYIANVENRKIDGNTFEVLSDNTM